MFQVTAQGTPHAVIEQINRQAETARNTVPQEEGLRTKVLGLTRDVIGAADPSTNLKVEVRGDSVDKKLRSLKIDINAE